MTTPPSAIGTLAATPLAHALIYARNRRLTGRLELITTDDRRADVSIWQGSITAVTTTPVGMCPGGFFGAIAYELGFIDSATLDETLLEIAKTKQLHGEVLIAQKAITEAQRAEVLVEQIHRKVHHLFSLSDETKYAFYDERALKSEPPVAVDCVGPVWRGIRDYPPLKFVAETSRRVGDSALRVLKGGSARLPPQEETLVHLLTTKPMTLAEMKEASDLPPARVELLVYLLVIAKNVESTSGTRTHPSTGALPVGMPSGPVKAPSGEVRRVTFDPPRRISSGSIAAVRPATPTAPITPTRLDAPPSSSRLPIGPGSSPRIPVAPGSSPSIPAANAARPSSSTLVTLKSPAELGHDGIVARANDIEQESFFEILGVPEGASAEAVRAAYMRLSKTWHPDRLHTDFLPVRGDVARIFSQMTKAQQTLCDPDARRAYVAARTAKTVRPRDDVMKEVRGDLERRQWDRVIQSCQGLIDLDTDDAEAIALQAWASTSGGEGSEEQLRAALTRMDRAVNVDRTNDTAIYHRGLVHKRLNNIPSAFRDFARALQLNPSNVDAEREVRVLAMRVKKGSGEHKLIAPILDRLNVKK